jgi:hypothetical protein
MKRVSWIITLIGSAIGFFVLIITLFGSNGAPQEAAGAAIAVAFSVIPYCFARALSEMEPKGQNE